MNKAILIVDDEPRVRLNYRVTLETEGFEVREADGAAAALAELKAAFNFFTGHSRYENAGNGWPQAAGKDPPGGDPDAGRHHHRVRRHSACA